MAAEIGLVASMVKLAKAAQRNKEKCHLLGTHVEQIMRLVKDLDGQWTPDAVNSMLKSLRAALNDAKELVESCQKTRTWSRVFKNQKKARKIDAIDAPISKIMEQFHVANMIIILSINKERFFMNVLEKLLADGACRRLPQSQKEELKSFIMSLTNIENMSSDAKSMLVTIIKEFTQGDARSSSSYVRPGAGRRGDMEEDVLTVEVVSLAVVIVEEAQKLREDRDEIQQLTKFVRLVSDLMQDPQYSELSRNTKTRRLVNNLKHNWARGPDDILEAAYKIEYYVHVLPVKAMRLIYEPKLNA